MSQTPDQINRALEQRVKLLEQALQQSRRIRQQFNDAQKALKASRGRYRALIQHAFDAIIMISSQGEIREANPSACRLFTCSEAELLQQSVSNLLPDLNLELAAGNSDNSIHEESAVRADGSIIPLEVSVTTIHLEDGDYFAITARDISARKQAETLRQQIQEELEALVVERNNELMKLNIAIEQASEILMITDTDGTIEYINDAFEKITGFSKAETIGAKPSILKSDHHDDLFFEKMWSTIAAGKSWEGRFINRRKDGSTFPALASISPVIDSKSNEITGYVCISQDMSAQEQMEDQLRQSQKMEAIGTLTSGIAHEFNNMLAGIVGNLYLLRRTVANDEKAAEKLASAEQLSQQAAQMIRQLLTFAHKDHAEMTALNLTALMKEAYKIATVAIPESTTMQAQFASDQLMVMGDATQLQQILINLLKNAADACDNNGTITVSLSAGAVDGEFHARHPGFESERIAHLQVCDNGCGIPLSKQSKVFEPFYTTKEVGQGTGLGLSMVYGAIKRHHGVIELHSIPGETRFDIYLPLIEQAESERMDELEIFAGQHEKILYVDDDDQLRMTTTEILTSLNYTVNSAVDGEVAVNTFLRNPYDYSLAILDVVMPKLGGVDAARLMRKINPKLPIVFLSGYDTSDIDTSGLNLDSTRILCKPYDIPELTSVIHALLSSED